MNTFNLGNRVVLIKTQDNLLGSVVGIYRHLKYMYNNPLHIKNMAESWAKYADVSMEEILEQNVYIIKLDKKTLPGTMEKAREYRDKFPDEESFLEWVEKSRVDRVSTFENDLVLSSDLVPDTLPEGI